MTKHTDSKAAKIRALLADGQKPKDIASILDVSQQYVYGVQNYERRKQKKAAVAAATRVSPITGKPMRKYKKRKVTQPKPKKDPLVSERNMLLWDRKRLTDELADAADAMVHMRQEIRDLRERPPVMVEVPVPQPFSHYTFMQRLRILFLGGAA